MTDRIRIADLARPVLTDSQRAAVAAAERMPVTLHEDVVLAAARQRTGLDDFGADDFRARLRVWLAAADEDPTLGPLGRLAVFGHAVRYLVNRLRPRICCAGIPRSATCGSARRSSSRACRDRARRTS